MSESDKEWTPSEQAALAALRRSEAPSDALEQRSREALRKRGLLPAVAPPLLRRGRAWWTWAPLPAIAAAAALFGIGLWIGRSYDHRTANSATADASALPRYVLFLEGASDPPPAEEARRVEEYKRWTRSVAAAGRLISGEKLKSDSMLLGPGNESGGKSIRGFFVIAARDDRDALEIARGCPHLRHGGWIVVRPIAPV